MEWFTAPDHWFSRLVLERGIAAICLIAFVCTARQFRAGMMPPRFLAGRSFWLTPSIFHLHYPSTKKIRAHPSPPATILTPSRRPPAMPVFTRDQGERSRRIRFCQADPRPGSEQPSKVHIGEG